MKCALDELEGEWAGLHPVVGDDSLGADALEECALFGGEEHQAEFALDDDPRELTTLRSFSHHLFDETIQKIAAPQCVVESKSTGASQKIFCAIGEGCE